MIDFLFLTAIVMMLGLFIGGVKTKRTITRQTRECEKRIDNSCRIITQKEFQKMRIDKDINA